MRLYTQRFQAHLERACYRLGLSIGYHPWRYICSLLLVTAISCIGFLRFHQINNARITFTASDSASHVEGDVMQKFLRQNGSLQMVEVLVRAADGGSLLREPQRKQLWDFSYEVATGLRGKDLSGRSLTYKDMCDPYCQKNDPFYALLKLYEQNVTDLESTYPTMEILGKQLFIANNVFDVSFKSNHSSVIKGFDAVILRYYMVHAETKPMLQWESQLVHLIYESNRFSLLSAKAGSDNLVAQEVRAVGTRTAPMLGLSLVLLMVFLVICSFRHRSRESKPWEALLGGVIPILAGMTTVGMVSASGLAFQSIVVSSLFLLLAIGIDDVFIMLSAWHRADRSLDIPHRVAEMVKESGCSMTVTSITNLVSFGNGVLSTTPVLQTFAIYSSVASVVCFVYQLVLFPAIITLTAPRECIKNDDGSSKKSCLPEEIAILAPLGAKHDRFWRKLAKIVTHPATAVAVIAILLAYWAVAIYGISNVETDLSVQKLAPAEARIVQFKNDFDKTAKMMQTVASVVTTPGDLRDEAHLERVKAMLKQFETATHSYGPESTFCFLQPFLDYIEFYGDGEDEAAPKFNYTLIPDFLRSDSYWRPTLRVNETACHQDRPECIEQFLFTTGFTTVVRYNEMYPLLEEWRAISARFPELGVYSYTDRSNFADQTQALSSVIWETLLSEVICMGLSFILLVPDTDSIIAAMFSLLSVNLGVFGFLSLWGVGVDPVSMAALLMSIGFSVDISAHISYHYYTVDAPSARARLEDAFLHIGWPTVQGGLSTLLAMLSILIRPSYLGMVFLKAVALVIVFGLIHGLIVLPVFLSLIDTLSCRRRDKVGSIQGRTSPGSIDSGESEKNLQPHRISIKSFTQYNIDRE